MLKDTEKGPRPFKIYPELKGHSVLIMDSEKFAREWADALRSMQEMNTGILFDSPDDLYTYIKDNQYESVIIHPNNRHDIDGVIRAYNNGIKVVVIPKSVGIFPVFARLNQVAAEAGLPCVDPAFRIYVHEAMAMLADQFKVDTS